MIGRHFVIYQNDNDYCAWPSIARAGNGDILVSFCLTEQHISPNGRIALVRSRDNGATWSAPEIIRDSILDDRQCGLTPLDDGRTLAHFWSRHWKRKEYEAGWFAWVKDAEIQERWLSTLAALDHDEAKRVEGCWTAFLDTNGMIGATVARGPETVHGGAQLANGDLLVAGYIGENGSVRVFRAPGLGGPWQKEAVISPSEPDRFAFSEPHLLVLPSGRILMLIRVDAKPYANGSPLCVLWATYSDDDGRTWATPFPTPLWGFPPHLAMLSAGRVLATYGYRRPPFGQRACVSRDGVIWDIADEIVLRDDAQNDDLGYPASLEIEPGKVLTVYYQVTKPRVSESLEYARPAGEKPAIMGTVWSVPGMGSRSEIPAGKSDAGHFLGRPNVHLGDPTVVAVSSSQYGEDPAGRWWGFFQFPDLWRGNDGVLYLAVNIGADSMAGRHEPTQFYASRDRGVTWERVAREATDLTPEVVTLPDGRQIAFGRDRYLYHHAELAPDAGRAALDVAALGLMPVAGPFRDGYKVNEYMVYRLGDIPESHRHFPLAIRASAIATWEETTGVLDFPDLRLPTLIRAMWWDEAGREEWKEFPPRLKLPTPHEVTVLPDGTLLWALASQHPDMARRYGMVSCLASTDAGRTWTPRGTIADTRDLSWGFTGEHALALMPDGDLLCVIRTKSSNEAADTHYLAAARSSDQGQNWTLLPPLAEFSVTPHLLTLDNGMVAVIYGRPGVHVKVSADSGRTWGEAAAVVGPGEKDLLAKPLDQWWAIRHDFSCANTSVVVTGPDRFLVAYSDFQHRNATGQRCKAICVREVIAGPEE